jgi:sulfatase maturation enzyme AslB (radical SAM superfamily)
MNALSIHPQGQAHYCLTSTQTFPSDLQELQNSREEIHYQLQSGAWPATCGKCQRKESKSQQSRRLHMWARKEKIYGYEKSHDYVEKATQPLVRHLDISFSNSCNLSCAMCTSEFSSGWIKHDKQAVAEGLEFRDFTLPFQKISRISEETLDYVLGQIENMDLIIIKGGEPTREPLCLDFLHKVAEKKKTKTSVFIQSNGTQPPEKWLTGLDNLEFEMGISMDGWEDVFNWIRGPYFHDVLRHIEALQGRDNVLSLTVDFTLSTFNVFHLPFFLEKILQLKDAYPKIKQCPVFQWVHQIYASPLALPLEDREKVLEKILPLLQAHPSFFLDQEVLIDTLKRPRLKQESVATTLRWFRYLQKIRGFKMGLDENLVEEALLSSRL